MSVKNTNIDIKSIKYQENIKKRKYNKGEEVLKYNGKNIYYTDINDLKKKLIEGRLAVSNISAAILINKLKNSTKRYIVPDRPGKDYYKVEEYDIKNNNRNLLKQNFGIKRINKTKELLESEFIAKKNPEIVIFDKLDNDFPINTIVKITLFVSFGSEDILGDIYYYYNDDVELMSDIRKYAMYGRKAELDNYTIDKLREIKPDDVYIDYDLKNSGYEKYKIVRYEGLNSELDNYIREYVDNLREKNEYSANAIIVTFKYEIINEYSRTVREISDYYLGSIEYKLEDWCNIKYIGETQCDQDSCLVRYISEKYPDLYFKIKELEDFGAITIKNFTKFCEKYNIYYEFRDLLNNVLSTNADSLTKFNKKQILRAVIYKNHIYPFSGGKLIKKYSDKIEIKNKINIEKTYIKLLEKKIIPSNLKIDYVRDKETNRDKISIKSFVHDKIKYFKNEEYDRCVEILKKIGIDTKIKTDIKMIELPSVILKSYKIKENISSFFLNKNNYKMKSILYESPKIDFTRNIVGTDKNKAFAYVLMNLPYLIRHDSRIHNIINFKGNIIRDDYLYTCRPKYASIPLPKDGLYPGYHLNECKKYGIDFDILEEFETETIPNHYKNIIHKLYKYLTPEEFKIIIVRLIGCFERNISDKRKYIFKGIFDKEESEYHDGYTQKLNDKYTMYFDVHDQIDNISDSLPIANQVKCGMFIEIQKQVHKLGIDEKDIIQINTDSIFYYGNHKKYTEEEIKSLRKDFNGWKPLYKKDFTIKGESWTDSYLTNNNILTINEIKNECNKIRILHDKYAGNGKTHYIINTLLPLVIERKYSYIILTPTIGSLGIYREKGLNCQTIQKYTNSNYIPSEEYVIIDEIGFCGRKIHDFIYKLQYCGKHIECFGDFNQLLEPGEEKPYNKQHYINYMFNVVKKEFINYRNRFDKSFYDEIINGKIKPLNIIEKYSTKSIKDADIILCYRNKTIKQYNKKVLELLGKEEFGIDTKIICNNNRLYEKYGIYNNMKFTIIKKIGKNVEIISELNDKIILPFRTIKGNFQHSYCINIFTAQGQSFKSYYWAPEDNYFIDISNHKSRIAYTLVSRIIQPQYISMNSLNFLSKIIDIDNNYEHPIKNLPRYDILI